MPLVLALAGIYFLLGRLSLLMAIPPGFASSIWPAAGVALIALLVGGLRLWPGVVLGSFLVNYLTTADGVTAAHLLRASPVPAAIGAGAALQALCGAWAVRRWVGFPRRLTNSREIALFLALGGPLSCLVSASVGIGALVASGAIDPVQAGFHWWTWWIGDSIGVLVVTPPILAFLDDPDGADRKGRSRVGLALLLSTGAVVVVFLYARGQQWRQLELEMGRGAMTLAHAFENQIDRSLDDVASIEALFAGGRPISRREFARFAVRILERNATLQALSWNPRVAADRRAEVEGAAQAEGFPGYRFTEAGPDGSLRPAGRRTDHVVVHYIEPYEGNEQALGFDITSDPRRSDAVDLARDSGRPAATSGIRLVQETGEQTGVLILMPVYADGSRPATPGERQRLLVGYATGVIRLGDALRAAFEGLPAHQFRLTLFDRSDHPTARMLAALPPENGGVADSTGLAWRFDRTVGGRFWTLEVAPTAGLLASHHRWYAWLVLAGGLVLVSLLGLLLLLESGRANELTELNRELEEGLARRRRLVAQRERLISDLELRNAELERFSHTVSHDLKSPLITIKGFLGLLERDLASGRADEVTVELAQLHRATNRMRELVDDLLKLSRAGLGAGPTENVELGEVVGEVVSRLRAEGRADGVQIEVDAELPPVRANREQLTDVVQNLVDNAVKFTRGVDAPRIEIGADLQGKSVICRVRDDGIGIDPAHHERIFGLFSRLDPSRDGTGIGLALVRRIVETSGGSVWVESKGVGHGSTFFFTVPAGRRPPSD